MACMHALVQTISELCPQPKQCFRRLCTKQCLPYTWYTQTTRRLVNNKPYARCKTKVCVFPSLVTLLHGQEISTNAGLWMRLRRASRLEVGDKVLAILLLLEAWKSSTTTTVRRACFICTYPTFLRPMKLTSKDHFCSLQRGRNDTKDKM